MAIDRAKFFDAIRNGPMPGALSQDAVRGINAILDEWERRGLTDLRWLAYMLATVLAECGKNMLPVREGFKATDEQARGYVQRKGYKYAVTVGGQVYYGRGLVQLTWQANYAKMSKLLGVDLVANPDLALDPSIASKIMFEGMIRGSFTGKKLGDYFNAAGTNWGARPIINGHDREAEIAGYGKQFYADLLHAEVAPHTLPAKPDAPAPIAPGTSPPPIALPAPDAPGAPKKRDGIVMAALAAIAAAAAATYTWATEHLPEIFIGAAALLIVAVVVFRLVKGYWPWASLHFPGVQSPAQLPLSRQNSERSSDPLSDLLAALPAPSSATPLPAPLASRQRRRQSAAPSRKTPKRPRASKSSKKSTRTRSSRKRTSR